MGAPISSSVMFSRGDNFLDFPFTTLEDKHLPKMASLRWEHFFFVRRLQFIYKGGNIENGRVASLEGVPIHLQVNIYQG